MYNCTVSQVASCLIDIDADPEPRLQTPEFKLRIPLCAQSGPDPRAFPALLRSSDWCECATSSYYEA
jgi:hypothetical protein